MFAALLLTVAVAAPEDSPPLKVGEPAPVFSLKTMNADLSKVKLFSLSKHVGEGADDPRRALVLSFSSWYCEPCKKELAALIPLQAKLAKAGVELAVVIIDTDAEGIESMRKLTVDQLKMPYPVLSDRFGVLAKRYRAFNIPYMVIVDRSGNIAWLHAGFVDGTLTQLTSKLGI